VVLAGLTKHFVEDRFRGRKPLGLPLRRSFVFALGGALVIIAAAAPTIWYYRHSAAVAAPPPQSATDPCYGADALRHDSCDPHGTQLLTSPAFAKGDMGPAWDNGNACIAQGDFVDRPICHFGSSDPKAARIALVGNSHAAQYLPALLEIAKHRNWQITTYLIFECYSVTAPIVFPTNSNRTANCQRWNADTTRDLQSGDYDLIVTSNRTFRDLVGVDHNDRYPAQLKAYDSELAAWAATGTPILDIREPPTPRQIAVDCVALHENDLSACDGTRTETKTVDPQADAAEAMKDPDVQAVDLSHDFCKADTCYSVIGGVIAYFNDTHITATFCRTLAPDIERAAQKLLDG
jgi:hypothetical protein